MILGIYSIFCNFITLKIVQLDIIVGIIKVKGTNMILLFILMYHTRCVYQWGLVF
jgi:hypothetical protein